jgi:hypothetical protein
MGSRFHNSLELAKSSWRVLADDKKLIVLPLLSGIASLFTLALFAAPVWALNANRTSNSGFNPISFVVLFLMYLALACVTIFFNAALVFAAERRLKGQSITLGEALAESAKRIPVLFPWAIVSATVSIIIRAIEERAGILGRIIGAFAGAAWAVVTFLVLPILVFEGIGPIAAVKRSGSLFKKTWGENIIANAAIGLLGFLAILAVGIPLALLALAGGAPGIIVALAVGAIWLLAVVLITSTLTGILQTALYRYATGGETLGFAPEMLRSAYRPRRGPNPFN